MNRRNAWINAMGLFLAHKLIVGFASLVFVRVLVSIPVGMGYYRFAFVDNFVRWDSLWYIRIAKDGYNFDKPAAFFPLYPYTIKLLHAVLGLSYEIAGLLMTNLSFLLALYLLVRLLGKDYSKQQILRMCLLLVVFPTSFYFSAVYTESMFLLLTVGCFYLLRDHKWFWSGLVGFLASLTRNTGVLLMIPFVYEYLAARRFQWREIKKDILPVLLIPLGLAFYMILLWRKIGDPLGFVHAQKYWGRGFLLPWQTLWQGTLDVLYKPRSGWPKINRNIELLAAYWEAFLLLVSLCRRPLRIRTGYLLYMVAAITVPLLSPSMAYSYFYSIPRFVTVVFPLFIIWGLLLEKKRWFIPAVIVSIGGQWYLLYKLTEGLFVF